MDNKRQTIEVYMCIEENDTLTFVMKLEEIERVFGVKKEALIKAVKTENKEILGPVMSFLTNDLLAAVELQFGRDARRYCYQIKYYIEEDSLKVNFKHVIARGNMWNEPFYDTEDDDYDDDECEDCFYQDEYEEEIKNLEIGPLAAVVCETFSDAKMACKVLATFGIRQADLFKSACKEYVIYVKDNISEQMRNKLLNVMNGEYGFTCHTLDESISVLLQAAEEHNDFIVKDRAIELLA